MANALDGQTRGAEYTLFPQPDSPAGRLFGHLVALQVPGTPIEIALSGLAGAVRLDPDVAAGALSRLATDGLISLDQEPESEHMSVTVMVAPPLDEYGIQPHWWETPDATPSDATPSDATPSDATPPPEVGPASGSLSNTGDARSRDKSGSRGNTGNSVSKANTGSSAPAGAGRERETMSERPEATAGAMTVPEGPSETVAPPHPPPGRPGRGTAARVAARAVDSQVEDSQIESGPGVDPESRAGAPPVAPAASVANDVPDTPPPSEDFSVRQVAVGREEASAEPARRAARARLRGATPSTPRAPGAPSGPGTPDTAITGRGAWPERASPDGGGGASTASGPPRVRLRPPAESSDVDQPPAPPALPAPTPKPTPPRDEAAPARQRPPGRVAGPPGGGSTDDTTLARGFVERFEKLLAEGEEWRRRAQTAEEQVTTTERLLRVAERRAADAEARLATAQERLRGWSELIQRMQQLTRQADTAGRTRASRPKPASPTP